ncbi:hypothetical protein JCM16814_28320 [Desulfobaculum senezii]
MLNITAARNTIYDVTTAEGREALARLAERAQFAEGLLTGGAEGLARPEDIAALTEYTRQARAQLPVLLAQVSEQGSAYA